jgi:transposase
MSWEQRCLLEQRVEFVELALSGDESNSELCSEFGISRSCGYKWLNRYQKKGGIVSLRDWYRRPHKSPSKTSEETEKRIRDLNEEYGWGPKKIHKLLSNKSRELPLITVRRIYERNGLRESRNVIGPALERFEKSSPNEMLQMDFKGQFMTD